MSKKTKKMMSMLLVVTLIAVIAVGGMLAYLTSEDSDVNVMTLGNVNIEQHEYERETNADGSYKTGTVGDKDSYLLKDFTQAKPIYPATAVDANGNPYNFGAGDWDDTFVRMAQVDSQGAMQVFKNSNAVDKFVTVENTGKSDAYVRTLYAFEAGSKTVEEWSNLIGISSFMTDQGVWKVNDIGIITVDGNNYVLKEFIYQGGAHLGGVHANGVLPAGETTYPGLAQVYMKAIATNEDCEALDGNNNGTYDILVLSQAVQTNGFADAQTALDTAFGDVTAENAPGLFDGIPTPNVLRNGKEVHQSSTKSDSFLLGNDIKTSDFGDSSARYGYGYEWIIRGGADYTLDLNGKTIEHDTVNENANKNAFTYTFVANHPGTKLTLNGDGKIYSHNDEGYTCAVQGKDGTLITINGGDYQVEDGIAVWAGAGSHIIINGGSFVNGEASTDHELIYSSGGVIDIYGGFFHNTDGNYTLNIEDRNRSTGFINVYGGTFVNFDPSTGGQDPNNIKVAEGYTVVSETQANGDVWYTVVPK